MQDKKQFFITVRNDGSYEQFVDSYGKENMNLIQKVPDGGFFVNPENNYPFIIPKNKQNIVISLAMDMPSVRFGFMKEEDGYNNLVNSFIEYIKKMISTIPDVFLHLCHIFIVI